jgi:replication fork clamp-binding protein CrfC
MKGGFIFKKIFFLCVLFSLSFSQLYPHLKKLAAPNLYSEFEVYKNDKGEWYSTSITLKFAKRTIDLLSGVKNAGFMDVLIPETKEILQNVQKKYGNFTLEKAFPNSSWADSIGTNIVTKEKVKLRDVLGRELTTLVNEVTTAGTHSVLWNGNNFASGIYFYSVTFKNQTLYRKMLLVK